MFRPTGPLIKPLRKDWLAHVSLERPKSFRRRYRLDLNILMVLLNEMNPYITPKEPEMVFISAGSPIFPEVRLAMTSRYLAGGQVCYIHRNFIISISEFYSSVWKVMGTINSFYPLELDLSHHLSLQRPDRGFAAKSRLNCLQG